MVTSPPAAPVNTMRREPSLASAILAFSHQFSIAPERAREMIAHGPPCLGRIVAGNAGHDARVLMLDAFEIGAPFGRRVKREPHALAWNDVAAEKSQEARELPVAGGLGNGAMKGEVFGDRALAAPQRAIDGMPSRANGGDLPAVRPLGCQCSRLDLDRAPQLHDVEDIPERRRARRGEAERARPRAGD